MCRGLFLQVEGAFGMRRAMLRGEDDLSGGYWFESSRRSKPQVSRLVCQVLKIALRRTCDFPFRRWPALRGSGLPQSVAEGSVEGFGGATVGEATPEVVVLGHGHLGVAELVGDLAGGEFAFVEQGGAGLAEHMAGDPGELAAAAGLAKLS